MRVMFVILALLAASCAQEPTDQTGDSSQRLNGMGPSTGFSGFTATGSRWGPGNSGFKPSEANKGFKGY